jgi:hypothetical protein
MTETPWTASKPRTYKTRKEVGWLNVFVNVYIRYGVVIQPCKILGLQNFPFVLGKVVFILPVALDVGVEKDSPTETSSILCTHSRLLLCTGHFNYNLGRKSLAYFKALHCTTGCTDVNHKNLWQYLLSIQDGNICSQHESLNCVSKEHLKDTVRGSDDENTLQ